MILIGGSKATRIVTQTYIAWPISEPAYCTVQTLHNALDTIHATAPTPCIEFSRRSSLLEDTCVITHALVENRK